VDPIDEIDGKKKRRTMLENMQRSSSLFQSKIAKSNENKAAEKAQVQARQTSDDSTDFSSEFTDQDSNLNSGNQTSGHLITNWEDILEDDEWLDEDEDEDEDEEDQEGRTESHTQEEFEEDQGEEELQPPPPLKGRPTSGKPGFFQNSFGSPPPSGPTPPPKKEGTAEQLGFSWGPVETRKADPALAARDVMQGESGNLEPVKEQAAVPAPPSGAAETYEPVSRVRPVGKTLPTHGQLSEVDDAIVRAARLLIATPDDEPGYEECIRLLSRFGLGAIRICSKAKVKVHILDEAGFAGFDELARMNLAPEEFPVDGAYLVKSRSCLIDRRCLTEKPRFFHPALYYFAHALDHAQGGDDFSSRKATAVLACFESSASGYNGADFVDELAATDPVRYFARSVSIYLERDDCDEPIWTHQDLHALDRSMYEYLQYLFARFAA